MPSLYGTIQLDFTRRRKDAKKDRLRKRFASGRICEPKGVGAWKVHNPVLFMTFLGVFESWREPYRFQLSRSGLANGPIQMGLTQRREDAKKDRAKMSTAPVSVREPKGLGAWKVPILPFWGFSLRLSVLA